MMGLIFYARVVIRHFDAVPTFKRQAASAQATTKISDGTGSAENSPFHSKGSPAPAPVAKSLQDAIFRTSTSPTKLKLHVQFNTATNVGLLLAAEVGASLVRSGRSVLDQGPPKREGYAASAGVAQW